MLDLVLQLHFQNPSSCHYLWYLVYFVIGNRNKPTEDCSSISTRRLELSSHFICCFFPWVKEEGSKSRRHTTLGVSAYRRISNKQNILKGIQVKNVYLSYFFTIMFFTHISTTEIVPLLILALPKSFRLTYYSTHSKITKFQPSSKEKLLLSCTRFFVNWRDTI